jgi:hypothetical protein
MPLFAFSALSIVWAKYIVPESTKKVAVAIEGISPFEVIEISD